MILEYHTNHVFCHSNLHCSLNFNVNLFFLPMEEYGCRGPEYDLRRDFYPLVLKFKKLDESLARFEISPLDYLISLVTLFDHITICYHINKIHLSFFFYIVFSI
jgi:hypothetical protein